MVNFQFLFGAFPGYLNKRRSMYCNHNMQGEPSNAPSSICARDFNGYVIFIRYYIM